MPRFVCDPESVAALIGEYRYIAGTEVEFQAGLAAVLEAQQIRNHREHDLGHSFGRIDFFLPESGIGIELKVKGGASQVLRQLHRYAQCPSIRALILVTSRSRFSATPTSLNGKPFLTVSLWDTQL